MDSVRLPWNGLETKVLHQWPESWNKVIEREVHNSSYYPKFAKLEGITHLHDITFEPGGVVVKRGRDYGEVEGFKIKKSKDWDVVGMRIHSITVVDFEDHPFLEELKQMPHVPRVVKSLYTKEVRLKHLKAMEAWDVMFDWDKALEAWEKYIEQ